MLPCSVWLSPNSQIVDAGVGVDEILRRAAQPGCAAFAEGVVVTSDGRYLGMISASSLAKAELDLVQRQAEMALAFTAFAHPLLERSQHDSRLALARAMPDHAVLGEQPQLDRGDDFFACQLDGGTLVVLFACTSGGRPCVLGRTTVTLWLDAYAEGARCSNDCVQPGELLSDLHAHLLQDFDDLQTQCQAAVLWLPRHGKSLVFASAGIDLLLGRAGPRTARAYAGSPWSLGQLADQARQAWPQHPVALAGAWRVVMATAGITQRRAGRYGDHLSGPLLLTWLRSHVDLPVREAASALQKMLDEHTSDNLHAPPFTLVSFAAGHRSE
jgi:hypothetical protein